MGRTGIAKISGVWWLQGEYACGAATFPRVPSDRDTLTGVLNLAPSASEPTTDPTPLFHEESQHRLCRTIRILLAKIFVR